jgi:hypothetical protein
MIGGSFCFDLEEVDGGDDAIGEMGDEDNLFFGDFEERDDREECSLLCDLGEVVKGGGVVARGRLL